MTLRGPKMYLHTKFGIPTSNNIGDICFEHDFLELRPEVKVTVACKPYAKLHNPKMYPQTKFLISISNNIGDMLWTCFSRTEARSRSQ